MGLDKYLDAARQDRSKNESFLARLTADRRADGAAAAEMFPDLRVAAARFVDLCKQRGLKAGSTSNPYRKGKVFVARYMSSQVEVSRDGCLVDPSEADLIKLSGEGGKQAEGEWLYASNLTSGWLLALAHAIVDLEGPGPYRSYSSRGR